MPLWLELCYVVNPAGKGGCKSKYPSSLFIWRQQRRKELVMCVKPASLVLSQTLLSVLELQKPSFKSNLAWEPIWKS